MEFESVKLKTLTTIKTGKLNANAQDKRGKYPFFTCAQEISRINDWAYDCECVLIAGNGDLNVKYYNGKFNAYQRTYIIESLNNNKLDLKFLFHFLNRYITVLRNGSIGGVIKYIKLGDLTGINLPLPPLETQKKIVEILEKAEKLKEWRAEADELANEYLKSVFVEMFGSPKENPFEWNLVTVNDIATKVTDGEHKTPKRTETGIKLLSARNVRMGHIDFSFGLDYVPIEEYERIKKRCNPEYGDLLISCSGVIIGRVATIKIKEPLALVRSAALIKPKKDLINSLYLEHYLRTDYLQLLMKRSSKASGQPNLFTGPLKKIPVLLPPLNLQNKFAEIVQQVETLKSYQSESDEQINNLFNNLMQKAFKGELLC